MSVELALSGLGAIGALGGLGGLSAFLRARALNDRDEAASRVDQAEAGAIEVRTARELIAEVRAEMDRRVSDLDREIGRLRGHLESVRRERDQLAATEAQLREENAQLRRRVESLEARIAEMTAERTTLAPPTVHVAVESPRTS